jgi:hypothetical protein
VSSILSVSLDLPFLIASDFIEDETHILLNCPFYDDFRGNLLNVAKSYTVDFMSFNNEEKIMFIFSTEL